MIFTTNKPLAAWGRVLHDEDLAQAIIDRILERGRLLTLDGPSLRTRHLGLDDPTTRNPAPEVARISGIRGPDFPEPTTLLQPVVPITKPMPLMGDSDDQQVIRDGLRTRLVHDLLDELRAKAGSLPFVRIPLRQGSPHAQA